MVSSFNPKTKILKTHLGVEAIVVVMQQRYLKWRDKMIDFKFPSTILQYSSSMSKALLVIYNAIYSVVYSYSTEVYSIVPYTENLS